VHFAARGIALLCAFCHQRYSPATVVYLGLPTYNTEFVALAVGTINLVEWEFQLCGWSLLGSHHCCFGSANRDDSFYGKTFDISYRIF